MNPSNSEYIKALQEKLIGLTNKQNDFSREISELWNEIERLKIAEQNAPSTPLQSISPGKAPEVKQPQAASPQIPPRQQQPAQPFTPPRQQALTPKHSSPTVRSDMEKFIGENLINKIGIAITVIGVAIGAKYSIDHELISPLTRIILGYMVGIGLMVFGMKLKKNYENFSAVLVSGAIAILYFITYAAFSFYGLFPQALAFILMVIFTAFTIVAAIHYNKQLIAHIGLVGAYAIPFLLSTDSGKAEVLFTYMALVNMGILIIAFKKYWKPLYYVSFILTWLIFSSWIIFSYQEDEHFYLALVFLTLFFATFYAIFLAYKLIKKEQFGRGDIVLILLNSFIFYGIGYGLLSQNDQSEPYLGLFTLVNAIIHFAVGAVIYKQKLADRNLFYMVAGLVLVFITIAIPVQLDGNWVTLLWVCEAALLFWIGRTRNVPVYEKLSYPIMLIACASLMQDWQTMYTNAFYEDGNQRPTPLLNRVFLGSLVFIAAFGFINYIHRKEPGYELKQRNSIKPFIDLAIPAILLIVIYFSFRYEIANYWNQLYVDSSVKLSRPANDFQSLQQNDDLLRFKQIWVVIYSMLFFTALTFLNIYRIKSRLLALASIGLSVAVLFFFLTQGILTLSELRQTYQARATVDYYAVTAFHVWIRYIPFACSGILILSLYRQIRQDHIKPLFFDLGTALDILLTITILVLASSELVTWMELMQSPQSNKLGLSILWGLYALILISAGIWKHKKHLRVAGIVLFSITLIKLFFYDIAHLDTIAKTIVFVSLGVLLLIISFLYNKYKHLIADQK